MDEIKQAVNNEPSVNSESKINYANFGERFIARIIDIIFTSVPGYILASILFSKEFTSSDAGLKLFSATIIGLFIYYPLYSPIMEARGGTFGKKFAKLQTIDIGSHKAPSLSQTYKRSLFSIVPSIVVLIVFNAIISLIFKSRILNNSNPDYFLIAFYGFTFLIILLINLLPPIAMLWSPTKQGWHDKFSKIVVIKNK
jgi:uncharacterized RDD family membrane protein YckC